MKRKLPVLPFKGFPLSLKLDLAFNRHSQQASRARIRLFCIARGTTLIETAVYHFAVYAVVLKCPPFAM